MSLRLLSRRVLERAEAWADDVAEEWLEPWPRREPDALQLSRDRPTLPPPNPQGEPPMSWLSKYVFDPVKAAISRASTSSNPAVSAAAVEAGHVVTNINNQVGIGKAAGGNLTANSAAALSSNVIKQFEDGLFSVADVFISAALAGAGPVGAVAAGPVVEITNEGGHALLAFGEQHAMTFLADLFSHARSAASAVPGPATTAQAIPTRPQQ